MAPFRFENLTLVVPELWEKPWDEIIAEAEGIEREFIATQARYARLLRPIAPTPVTPEKVGWLALWSRLFGCLSGGRGAIDWEARLAISVLTRVAFETALHLQAVMLPVLNAADLVGSRIDEKHWAAARDRLRACVTWSLRGDEALYRHVSSDRILDEAFDPRKERAFIEMLGENKAPWESLSGQRLEVVSDQEASFDRSKAVARFRKKRNRLSRWLSDPRLKPWYRQIRELEKHTSPVSLFLLLGVGNSVPAFLRSRGLGIGYFEYLQGSAVVHGSSLEASMLTTETLVAPDFANLDGSFEESADRLLSNCRLQAVLLDIMSGHLQAGRNT
jgi:hypothetical protein